MQCPSAEVLVCRIAGGNALYTDAVDPDGAQIERSCLTGEYDSVIGDREKCRGTYKESSAFLLFILGESRSFFLRAKLQ